MFLRHDWEREVFIACECLDVNCLYYDKHNHYCKFVDADLYEIWYRLPCDEDYNNLKELEED